MSTDYEGVCDKCRVRFHVGQRFSVSVSFGYGSDDAAGRERAASLLFDHASDCEQVRVVHSDNAPDDYKDLDED